MKAELPVVGEEGEEPPRQHRCENCKWWVRYKGSNDDEGQCQRHPPTLNQKSVPKLNDDGSNEEEAWATRSWQWAWTVTEQDDFCGEWAAIPAPAGGGGT